MSPTIASNSEATTRQATTSAQPNQPSAEAPFPATALWQHLHELTRLVSDPTVETLANDCPRAESESPIVLSGFIATSPTILRVLHLARRMAQTDWPILIEGESGTGKECLAQWIHRWSRRQAGPLIAVNCAALPETLAESELFGWERGSFTGASASRAGYLELADGGTLLLDEISELPLPLQSKLLRVLEQQQVQRLGSTRAKTVSVRILALSNQSLDRMVQVGRFRADLFYRLNVLRLQLPPLRQRPEDIAPLAEFFLDQARQELGHPKLRFASSTLDWLAKQPWPGNVRQLRNAIFQAALLALLHGETVLPEHFPALSHACAADIEPNGSCGELLAPGTHVSPASLGDDQFAEAHAASPSPNPLAPETSELQSRLRPTGAGCDSIGPLPPSLAYSPLRLDALERAAIAEALRRTGGHRRRAAHLLGISLRTLFNKLRRYQLTSTR